MSRSSTPKQYFTVFQPGRQPSMNFKYRAVSHPEGLGEKSPLRPVRTMSTLTDLDGLDDVDLGPEQNRAGHDWTIRQVFRRAKKSNWIWLVHVILLVASITLFTLASLVRTSTLKHVQDFSAWSPAAGAVQYDKLKYNINLEGNGFVGAGPDVDRAWREISVDVGEQWLSKGDLDKLEMPPNSLTAEHPQSGEEGYRIGVQVFHHLYCLDLLRKATYRDYYQQQKGVLTSDVEELQRHTDLCIEILRLHIGCSADVGVFTFYTKPNSSLPEPQFNSKHVCRNFDSVRQWAVDNSVGSIQYSRLALPESAIRWLGSEIEQSILQWFNKVRSRIS